MQTIKVSANYWNSLTTAAQTALSDLAYKYGLQYAKRIITIANKHFPTFTDIAPLAYYSPEIPAYLTNGVFVAIDNGAMLGIIQKGAGIGITERVKKHDKGNFLEIWHN